MSPRCKKDSSCLVNFSSRVFSFSLCMMGKSFHPQYNPGDFGSLGDNLEEQTQRGWEEIKLDSYLIPHCGRMNVGVAHSEVNPNTRVMNSRGIWLAYIILVGLLHVVLLSIPFFSIPVVWTLTNVIHNLAMYVFLHTVKGTPFETPDQGKARLLTHWEQMDYGLQFTSSRKFLSISPIVLYLLASFYTKYDAAHFLINTVSLLSVLLPKLPQFHGVRLFGINKYWGMVWEHWNKGL